MKRFLALVAAVAMVAGAFFLRDWLDDSDTAGGDDDASSPDEASTLLCDPALAVFCRELDDERDDLVVEIADSAAASARLEDPAFSSRSDPVDGWLVPAPFPAMVDESRQRAGLGRVLGDPVGPLARSPLVITMWRDREAALAPSCADDTVGWRCIGDNAGRPWTDVGGLAAWGRVEPGFEPPSTSAVGLLVMGQAATDFFETPDFASNDFDRDGFRSWLRDLEDSVPSLPATTGSPLDKMLAAGPASYDLVGGLEAEAGPKVTASRDRDRLAILYPSTMATADLQFAPVAGADGAERLGELLQDDDVLARLAAHGWRVDGQDLATGLPPDIEIPSDSGLPRPGVMQALRDL